MTPAIIPIGPAPAGVGTSGKAAAAGTGLDPDSFRTTLATQTALAAPPAATRNARPTAAAKPTADATELTTTLQTKIAQMLEAGASQADVTAAIAATLAKATADKLGVAGADARKTLQTVFATALAPPGDESGSTASIAERARTLAQRAVHVASIADTVIPESGQQKRIAGNLLDAHKAKDIPAQTTAELDASTMLASSFAHAGTASVSAASTPHAPLAATVAPSLPATLAAPTSTLDAGTPEPAVTALAAFAASTTLPNTGAVGARPAATTGDGRTVNSGSRTAVSTGGDTSLGRVLTRAMLAGDAAQPATTGRAPAPPAAAVQAATAPAADASASAGSKNPDAAVAAFVKSFAGALSATATEPHPHTASTPLASPALPALPVSAATSPAATAFVPSVAPFTIEHAQPVAAPPPPAAPAPADPSAIADQLVRGAFLRTSGDSSEVRLKLVPETLGDLSVKLSVESGNVTAHVVAETSEARDALVAAQPQLTKSLAEAGLKLTGFTVDLSGNGFAGFAQQQNGGNSSGGNRSRRISGVNVADDAADDAIVDAVPSFAPPVVAGGRPGDYNYLV